MNKTEYSLPCSFSARLDSCEDREQIHKTKMHITTQTFWCRQDAQRSHPPLNVVFFKLVYLSMQQSQAFLGFLKEDDQVELGWGFLCHFKPHTNLTFDKAFSPWLWKAVNKDWMQAWFQTSLLVQREAILLPLGSFYYPNAGSSGILCQEPSYWGGD